MSLSFVVLAFAAMLLAALLLEPLAGKLHLPFSAVLVAAGFAGSQLIVGAGFDTGLRWHHFHDLVFFVFLPVLIFHAAMDLEPRVLFRNLPAILILALPVVLISTALIAAALYFGIGHASGYPVAAALISGAILSASDPVTVGEIARRIPLPRRLLTLLEGESLVNDATTIVLFMLLLGMAHNPAASTDIVQAATGFLRLSLGGLLVGAITAMAGWGVLRLVNHSSIVTLLAAFGCYLVAEQILHVSGVMASLACGLILRCAIKGNDVSTDRLNHWWSQLGWMANSSLFLLAGVTVTLTMFQQRWLAMLIGIGAALLARLIAIWGGCTVASILPGQENISSGYRLVLWLGGTRGAVTLALALSLPTDLPGWWTVQSIAYGVVMFSLFIQAPLLEPLINRLKTQKLV